MVDQVHRDLFELFRGYAALIPPKHLLFPLKISSSDIQFYLINSLLFNQHFRQYPPSRSYQRRFWKWVIDHLESFEEEDFEVDPRIYDHYLSLLSQSSQFTASQIDPPSQSFTTHLWRLTPSNFKQVTVDPNSYQSVTLLESRTTIENGTTGMRTWSASFMLSQYLISHPDLIACKHVLELGCGAGFLGAIVAGLQFHSSKTDNGQPTTSGSLCLSDLDESVLARCHENISRPYTSSLHPQVTYRTLDWSHALNTTHLPHIQSLLQYEIDAEIILGADLVFDPSLIPALVATIRLALQPGQRRIEKMALIALALRRSDTLAEFFQTAADQGLLIEEIHFEVDQQMFLGMLDIINDDEMRLFKITLQ